MLRELIAVEQQSAVSSSGGLSARWFADGYPGVLA
jgi:hypothetical protein